MQMRFTATMKAATLHIVLCAMYTKEVAEQQEDSRCLHLYRVKTGNRPSHPCSVAVTRAQVVYMTPEALQQIDSGAVTVGGEAGV